MTLFRTAAIAASLVLITASAQAATQMRIDCGDIDVILQEDQAQTVAEVAAVNDMNGEEFAKAVCELFSDFDPAEYDKATGVKIMKGDRELEAEIEASQQ